MPLRSPTRELPELMDARVYKAVSLMQSAPERRWSVRTLAKAVALSRPVFARRFVTALGVSPARFLAECRMARAAELLLATDAPLAKVAQQVGYVSEFAFSRAFKRRRAVAPGAFRRSNSPGVVRCFARVA